MVIWQIPTTKILTYCVVFTPFSKTNADHEKDLEKLEDDYYGEDDNDDYYDTDPTTTTTTTKKPTVRTRPPTSTTTERFFPGKTHF